MKDYIIRGAQKPPAKTEDTAKYDIVLIDITRAEGMSGKAKMALAYVLFEDMAKAVYAGSEPSPYAKKQMQEESVKRANEMAKNIPVTLRKSVAKKEALFFKERLAKYGVTALIGYCPNCGGSLNKTSEKCTVCGHEGVELSEKVTPKETKPKDKKPQQEKRPPQKKQSPQRENRVSDTPRETVQSGRTVLIMAVVIAILSTILVIASIFAILYFFVGNEAEVNNTPTYSDQYFDADQPEPTQTAEIYPIFDIGDMGNSSGNIASGGLAAIQGEWIYFFGGDGLYRKMIDGSNEEKLTDGNLSYINVDGDIIYFTSIEWGNAGTVYRIEADGSNRQAILSVDGRISNLHVIGDWMYYIVTYFDANQTSSVYRMRKDGSDKHLLFDSFEEGQINVAFSEDWIYWGVTTSGLYRVSVTDREIVERIIDIGLEDIGMINVVNDWVYFTVFCFNTEESTLYRARTDGTDRQMLSDEFISNINVSGDWVYSINRDNVGISRVRIDGSDRESIVDFGNIFTLSVVGNWIYFTLSDLTTQGAYIYRINTDGSNLEQVYTSAAEDWSDPEDTFDSQNQSTTEMLYHLVHMPAERVTIYIHWQDGDISYFTNMGNDSHESQWMMYNGGSSIEISPEFVLVDTNLEIHYLGTIWTFFEDYMGILDGETFFWRYELHFP